MTTDNLPNFNGLEDLARYEELAKVRTEVSFIQFFVVWLYLSQCLFLIVILKIAMSIKIQHTVGRGYGQREKILKKD